VQRACWGPYLHTSPSSRCTEGKPARSPCRQVKGPESGRYGAGACRPLVAPGRRVPRQRSAGPHTSSQVVCRIQTRSGGQAGRLSSCRGPIPSPCCRHSHGFAPLSFTETSPWHQQPYVSTTRRPGAGSASTSPRPAGAASTAQQARGCLFATLLGRPPTPPSSTRRRHKPLTSLLQLSLAWPAYTSRWASITGFVAAMRRGTAVLLLLGLAAAPVLALDKAYIEDSERFPGWRGELPDNVPSVGDTVGFGELGQVRATGQLGGGGALSQAAGVAASSARRRRCSGT